MSKNSRETRNNLRAAMYANIIIGNTVMLQDNEQGITLTNYYDSNWNKSNKVLVWTSTKYNRYYIMIPISLSNNLKAELSKGFYYVDICKRTSNNMIRFTFEDKTEMPYAIEISPRAMPLGINTNCTSIMIYTGKEEHTQELPVSYVG